MGENEFLGCNGHAWDTSAGRHDQPLVSQGSHEPVLIYRSVALTVAETIQRARKAG